MTNTKNLGQELERFDFEYLIRRAIDQVSEEVDTREGSIIYDALAPACMELAEMYLQLKNFYDAVFIQTTYDGYLDLRVAEQGLTRHAATKAIRQAIFRDSEGDPMVYGENGINTGDRFSTIHPTDSLNYVVVKKGSNPGYYHVECEEYGAVGNRYGGPLLPVSHINGLGSAVMLEEAIELGLDAESDDVLRRRFLDVVNTPAFGGNVAQYREEILRDSRVGAVQVYPAWAGGGTVKCSILDHYFNRANRGLIDKIQKMVDPRDEEHPERGYVSGLGMAPIGHEVTIDTAENRKITVRLEMEFAGNQDVVSFNEDIFQTVEDYFKELRQNWDQGDQLNNYRSSIFTSQIIVRLVGVPGVTNARNVQFSDELGDKEIGEDLPLIQTGHRQQIPYLEKIILTNHNDHPILAKVPPADENSNNAISNEGGDADG